MQRATFYLVLCFSLLVGTRSISAQENGPPKAEPAPIKKTGQATVKTLVARLADREFAVREKADADLRALGSEVLPELEKYLNDEDAEVRTRMKAIVDFLRKPVAAADDPVEETASPLRPIERDASRPAGEDGALPRFRDFGSFEEYRRALEAHLEAAQSRGALGGLGSSIVIGPGGQGGTSFRSSKTILRNGERLTITQGNEGVSVVIEPRGGERKTYSARDLESFKKDNAEIYERYKGTGLFENNIIQFDVLRPDVPEAELSERERATQRRLKRLLDLSQEDPFADFNERFRDLVRRQDEMDRSLRERLDSLLGSGRGVDLFGEAERLRRSPDRTRRTVTDDRPRLGVVISLPSAGEAARLDPEKLGASGVRVTEVEPGSLADTMGLKVGDILLRCNTTSLNAPADLVKAFATIAEGEKVSLGVLRGEESLNLSGMKPMVKLRPATDGKLKRIDPSQLKKF